MNKVKLIKTLEQIQDLSGKAKGAFWNDRDPMRAEHVVEPLEKIFDLCVQARSSEKPTPEIVCLCGSTRFGEAFRIVEFEETLKGNIVLTIGCNMKSDNDLFGNMAEPAKEAIKNKLDELHLRKIDLADRIKFLNVGGYIGTSTKRELKYSKNHNKKIEFLEPIGAPNIRDPEFPCEDFEPIGTAYGDKYKGECETDGHYMCDKCIWRKPSEDKENNHANPS